MNAQIIRCPDGNRVCDMEVNEPDLVVLTIKNPKHKKTTRVKIIPGKDITISEVEPQAANKP